MPVRDSARREDVGPCRDRNRVGKSEPRFLKVYNGFTRAKGLPGLRPHWIQDNSAHCETLVLYLDGQPLCSHVMLRDPETGIVRLLYSGSRRLESPERSAACGIVSGAMRYAWVRERVGGCCGFTVGGNNPRQSEVCWNDTSNCRSRSR